VYFATYSAANAHSEVSPDSKPSAKIAVFSSLARSSHRVSADIGLGIAPGDVSALVLELYWGSERLPNTVLAWSRTKGISNLFRIVGPVDSGNQRGEK